MAINDEILDQLLKGFPMAVTFTIHGFHFRKVFHASL